MNLSLVYRSFLRYDIFKRYDIFIETGFTIQFQFQYLNKLIVMSFFCHFWNDILELTLPYETNSVGFRFLNSKWLFKKYLTAHFGPASTSSSILDDSSELLYLWTFYSKQVFAVKIRGQISRIIFLDSYFWIRIIWNFRE